MSLSQGIYCDILVWLSLLLFLPACPSIQRSINLFEGKKKGKSGFFSLTCSCRTKDGYCVSFLCPPRMHTMIINDIMWASKKGKVRKAFSLSPCGHAPFVRSPAALESMPMTWKGGWDHEEDAFCAQVTFLWPQGSRECIRTYILER